jgi:hypothetical protein
MYLCVCFAVICLYVLHFYDLLHILLSFSVPHGSIVESSSVILNAMGPHILFDIALICNTREHKTCMY